jgi:hypothetical protein
VIGNTRYSALCRELGLAGEAIDDIPDRETLKALLERAEAEATRMAQGARAVPH